MDVVRVLLEAQVQVNVNTVSTPAKQSRASASSLILFCQPRLMMMMMCGSGRSGHVWEHQCVYVVRGGMLASQVVRVRG
jgi:hypothetical protein